MARFDLSDTDVRWTLHTVYWLQASWMIVAGALLTLSPMRRFGNAYAFVFEVPGGQFLLGGIYLVVGISLIYAIVTEHQPGMARGLLVGGVLSIIFGAFLFVGTINGPTGVIGWLFCAYVGPHMLLQSVLLSKRSQ